MFLWMKHTDKAIRDESWDGGVCNPKGVDKFLSNPILFEIDEIRNAYMSICETINTFEIKSTLDSMKMLLYNYI